MTLAMAYAVLLSAAIAAGAALLDFLLRPSRLATRWLWVLGLVAVVPVTAFVMLVPRAQEPAGGVVMLPPTAAELPLAALELESRSWASYLDATNTALALAWVVASVLLLGAIGLGQWRLRRAQRGARRGEVLGHDVLLTEDLGPAVAGVARPVVFVPRWVTALDDASQRLLLAHELEHARRRDTLVLMGGALVTALLPWNPVVWWLGWRLRVAVELDCDRRVLAVHPGVRQYVDLLLLAAGKPRLSTRLLAARFGEHASDLERRIDAMTNATLPWRSTLAAALLAGVLFAVACETPRPEPVAPTTNKKAVTSTVDSAASSSKVYLEFQVEKPVTQAPNSAMPRYPDILRQAGVEGEVLAAFVVDANGLADPASFKVLRATHELFAAAVKEALPGMRYVPAEVGGKRVRQLVQQPYAFAIVGDVKSQGPSAPKLMPQTEPKRLPPAGAAPATDIYYEFQVEKPVTSAPGTGAPRYPAELRSAGVEGDVLAMFVVNEDGLADPASFKAIRATHDRFTEAVKEALPAMRFVPAEVGGRKVKQIVQQPFQFRIARDDDGTVRNRPPSVDMSSGTPATGIEPKRLGAEVPRREGGASVGPSDTAPHVYIVSSRGEQLYAALGRVPNPLPDLRPDALASVEVFKGPGCPDGLSCPAVLVRLKPGLTLATALNRSPS